jgi:hypothetical protein
MVTIMINIMIMIIIIIIIIIITDLRELHLRHPAGCVARSRRRGLTEEEQGESTRSTTMTTHPRCPAYYEFPRPACISRGPPEIM